MNSVGMQDEKLLVKCIAFLRFPLIVAVMVRHNNAYVLMDMADLSFETSHYHGLWFIDSLFRCFILNARVPMFFFISGLLFFRNTHQTFNKTIYLNKLRNRFHSLVIPYIFWNLFILVLYAVCQSFPVTEAFFSGTHKMIRDYTLKDFLLAFWNCFDGFPINYIFWFVRDLIILSLLSPVLYYLIKYLRWYFLVLLGTVWLFYPLEFFPGIKLDSFLFFMIGAWFTINGVNFITRIREVFFPSFILFIVVGILNMFMDSSYVEPYIYRLSLFLSIPVVFNVVRYGIEKGKIKESLFLASASFFVFAAHEPLLTFVRKLVFIVCSPHSEISLTFLFIFIPTIIVAITLSLYYVLRKYTPAILKVIAGGR